MAGQGAPAAAAAAASTPSPLTRCIPNTPADAMEARAYPCFCPLCFGHYAAVLATSCCRHHICAPCAHAYLSRE
jgi:hypothetical protein